MRRYRKSSDNGGGVFGEEELYDISSDTTYSNAIDKLSAKINGEFKDVFKSLDSEYIARTYLMAKNIADTTRLIDQNAQYDIGSNIVSRTPGGYDNQVLLSDLQLITLDRDPNTGKYTSDADEDGIIDGKELGNNDGTYTPLKITGFIEKMLKAEAGNEYSEEMLDMYKANIADAATAADNAENRGNIVTPGRDKEKFIQTQHDLRVVGNDIYVDVMSYKSNPILKDTDFDGIWDGYGKDDEEHMNIQKDTKPLDNTIGGQITMANGNNFTANTHMDYRYFFMDEYNYYDELAEMSLILSQSVYNRNNLNLTNLNLTNLNSLNEKIDARLINRYLEADDEEKRSLNNYDYKTNYAIGHHYVEYSKDNSANNYIKKMIIPIAIPGMTEISDARSYSDIGKPNWIKEDGAKIGEEQHNVKSYEVYAEMIKHDIDDYIRENHLFGDYKKVYWITGYKEGGAITNILAAKLRDMGDIVYTYTFGAPMTIYNNPDEPGYTKTGYSARYDCIFNVVNEDDAYAYMMPQELGFSRYGMTCFASGREIMNRYIDYKGSEEIREEVIDQFNKIYKGKENKTRTYIYNSEEYKETFTIDNHKVTYNTIHDYLGAFLEAIKADRGSLTFDNIKSFCQRGAKANNIKVFKNKVKANYEKLKRAGDEDVYYILAEHMDNADITNVVNLYDKKERIKRKATASDIGISPQEFITEALEVMGQQYVKNVSTYSGSGKYTLEQVSKDVDTAYIKNQYNTLTGVDISEQKEEIKQKFKSLIDEDNWFKCGDDCVRFMFSVIFYANNGNLGTELKNNNSEKYYTMFGTNILTGNKNDQLFKDLGFDIYYIGEVDSKGHEFGYEDLEDGDIVVAYRTDDIGKDNRGHIEFYINDRYGKNGNGTYDWSFGWGSQKASYPVNGNIGKITKEDSDDTFYKVNNNYKKKYLLDNFANLIYDGDGDGKPDRTYELRYFKVLRKAR